MLGLLRRYVVFKASGYFFTEAEEQDDEKNEAIKPLKLIDKRAKKSKHFFIWNNLFNPGETPEGEQYYCYEVIVKI